MSENIQRNENGEIVVLGHSPWPGYRLALYLVFTAAALYLLLSFCGFFSSGGR